MDIKIEYLRPDLLRPSDRNARTHTTAQVSQIAASIREFGFTNPVLADKNNLIIAGHGRVLAALQLDMPAIPVIRLGHLSERQVRALTLADNKIALNSGWDFAKLSEELSELAMLDFDLTLTAFDEQELDVLLKSSSDVLPEFSNHITANAPANENGLSVESFGTSFTLPDGDKAPFQQMTFTFADEQAKEIKNAIAGIKQTEEYRHAETMGNENPNGNALYLIVKQWAEQKK